MKDLEMLRREVARFIDERDWDMFHSPKNLAMSVSIEAAELMELFQWLTPEESGRAAADPAMRVRIQEEMADTFIYLLSLASRTGIDLGEAVLDKLEKNRIKYPVEQCRGHWTHRAPASGSPAPAPARQAKRPTRNQPSRQKKKSMARAAAPMNPRHTG